jgi:choline-sulfatase
MARGPNILFICADELTRCALHCYGAGFVHSPNLDRLARRGTCFSKAYTNSPLCVPARGAMATGLYVHRVGCWDNGHPYHGAPPGWTHKLRASGYTTVSIGKNHYRSTGDDNGFVEEMLPMHVRGGVGDLFGMLRKESATYPSERVGSASPSHDGASQPVVRGPATMAEVAGAGESNHTEYDRQIAKAACKWLDGHAGQPNPWALYVSFVAPHFPLVAPKEFFDLYDAVRLPPPVHYAAHERPTHPVVSALARIWNYDDYFTPDKLHRARAGYYGLVSFLDHHVGMLLDSLERAAALDDTVVLFTSDHGEMLGNKGIWSTSALYEESVGIPLIVAGPGIAAGVVQDRLVSHVDIHPTLLGLAGADPASYEGPGESLLRTHAQPRAVLSEYHAGASITGCFMLRTGRWKYMCYPGYPPQLFDMESDPTEAHDLAESGEHREVLARCDTELRQILDPVAVNEQAFAAQAATILRHGGVEAVKRRGHPGEHAVDRTLGVE